MPQPRARRQQQLFEEPPAVPAVRTPLDVQQQLRRALVQWMQALVKMICEETTMNKITAEHLARRACV
jgi:hypothetical protein